MTSKAAKREVDSDDRSMRCAARLAEVRIKGAEWEKILTSPEAPALCSDSRERGEDASFRAMSPQRK